MQNKRELEHRLLSELTQHPRSSRTHPAQQITLLTRSIERYGITQPLFIDENDVVLAGNARRIAAGKAGLVEVPVIVGRGLSEAEKRGYVLWDNKSSELGGYNREALADELRDLSQLLPAEGFDLEITGFSPAEIDVLFADIIDQTDNSDDDLPPLSPDSVTRRGDLWILGNKHRLLCENALDADYSLLMQGNQATQIATDPPYNIDVSKAVGRGRTKHPNFSMAGGEMRPEEFTSFLEKALRPAVENTKKGALCYVFMDWRHQREILDAGDRVFGAGPEAVVVWKKN